MSIPSATLAATTPDTTAPKLTLATPGDNMTAVAADADIVLTFDEAMLAGKGQIVISDGYTQTFVAKDGSLSTRMVGATDTRTLSLTDSQVKISGNTVTIHLAAPLKALTGYNVTMAAGVLTDVSGNAYAGLPDSTRLNFITSALKPPTALVDKALHFIDSGASTTDFITSAQQQTVTGSYTGTLATGDVVQLSIDNGAHWVGATVDAATHSWTWSGLFGIVDTAASVMQARVYNVRGGASTAVSQAYTLDKIAPTVTLSNLALAPDSGSSATDFITNQAAQTIKGSYAGTLDKGDLIQVSLDGGLTWSNASTDDAAHTWSASATLAEGKGTLQIRAVDLAGNVGATLSHDTLLILKGPAATLGTLALSADTGVSSTDFITKSAGQTIKGSYAGTLAATDLVQVSLDQGATWTSAGIDSASHTWSTAATLAEGKNTLQVRTIDVAGNTGAVISKDITLDTTAPGASATVTALSADTGARADDFMTKTAAQTIQGSVSGALDTGDLIQASLDNGATWTNASVDAASGTWNAATTLAEGKNTLQVRTIDLAGNSGAVASKDITLDTKAPGAAVSVTALSADTGIKTDDFVTRTAAQTIHGAVDGTLDTNDLVQISLDGGATWSNASVDAAGSAWSAAATLAEGKNTLQVRSIDLAGNTGTVVSKDITLDTKAPGATATVTALSADTGIKDNDFITKTAAQTVKGSIDGTLATGELLQVSLDQGSTWTDATVDSGGATWSASATLAEGKNTLQTRITDLAGNTGTVASKDITLDTKAPTAVASVTAISADTGAKNNDFITKTAAQTVKGSVDGTLATGELLQVSLDQGDTWVNATIDSGGGTWSASATLAEGKNTLQTRITDLAGNTGTVGSKLITLDTKAPTAVLSVTALSADTGAKNNDFITRTAAQTIKGSLDGTLDTGDLVQVSLDQGTTWTDASVDSASHAWSASATLLEGKNMLQMRTIDLAGNASSVVVKELTLDTKAPTAIVTVTALSADTGAKNNDFITKTAVQTIKGSLDGTLDTGDLVQVSLDQGTSWANATLDSGGSTWSASATLVEGKNTLQVRTIDLAGNAGSVASKEITLDSKAPTAVVAVTALSDDTGLKSTDFITRTAGQTVTGSYSGNLGTGELIQISMDNGANWTDTSVNSANHSWSTVLTLIEGKTTLQVRTIDLAGNIGPAVSKDATLDTKAPDASVTVTALSADTGISGTDFITKTAQQTISGSYDGTLAQGDLIQISLDGGATWINATREAAGSSWSATATLLDGKNIVQVRAADLAGNLGPVAEHEYTLLSQAPAVRVSGAAGRTNSADSVQITLSSQQGLHIGDTIQIVDLNNGAAVIGAYTLSAGDFSQDGTLGFISKYMATSVLTDGSHTLQAQISDVAGNVGSSAGAFSVIVDTRAPALQTSSPADGGNQVATTTSTVVLSYDEDVAVTRSASIVVTDGTTANDQVLTIDNGGISVSGHTLTLNLSRVLDGASHYSVVMQQGTVADASGNVSVHSGDDLLVFDTAAGNTPTVSSFHLSSDNGLSSTDFVTNVTSQTISGSYTNTLPEGGHIEVSLDNGQTWNSAITNPDIHGWSYSTTLAVGSGTLQARIAGSPGTAVSHSYTVDITPPAVALTAAQLELGSGGGGGGAIHQGFVFGTDPISAMTSQSLPSIHLNLNAASGYAAGDIVEIVDLSDDNTIVGSYTLLASDLNSSHALYNSNRFITLNHALSDGSHTLAVQLADLAGNSSGLSDQHLYLTVDTVKPTLASATPANNATGVTSGNTIVLTFSENVTLSSGVSFTVSDGNNTSAGDQTLTVEASQICVTDNTVTLFLPYNLEINSTYDVKLSAGAIVDAAGNSAYMVNGTVLHFTTGDTLVLSNIALSNDSGVAGDLVTNVAAQTVSGTYLGTLGVSDYVEVSLDGGDTWSTASVNRGTQTWSLPTTLTGGTHVISARLGSDHATSLSHAYTLDTVAAAVSLTGANLLTLQYASDSGISQIDQLTNVANNAEVRVNLNGTSGFKAGDTIEVVDSSNGNAKLGSYTLSANEISSEGVLYSYLQYMTLGHLSDGEHVLKVRIGDLAGNTPNTLSNGYVVHVDTVAPTVSLAAATLHLAAASDNGVSSTDNATELNNPNMIVDLSGVTGLAKGDVIQLIDTNHANAVVAYYSLTDDDVNLSGVVASPLTMGIASQLSFGSHTLRVRVSDAAGNAGGTSTASATIDQLHNITTAQVDLAYGSDSGYNNQDNITSATAPLLLMNVGGSSGYHVGDTVTVFDVNHSNAVVGSYTLIASDVNSYGGFTHDIGVTPSSPLSEGAHDFKLRLTDAAGIQSLPSTNALTVTIDTTAPTLSSSTPAASASVAPDSGDIVLTFNEAIKLGTNTVIALTNGSQTPTMLSGSSLSISGNTLTLHHNTLDNGASYTVSVNTGNIADLAGNIFDVGASSFLNFSTPSYTVPLLNTSLAISNDTGVDGMDGVTNSTLQTLSGSYTGTLGSDTIKIVIAGDNNIYQATVNTTNHTWSFDASSVFGANSNHTYHVDVYLASTPGTMVSTDITIDTVAPAASVANVLVALHDSSDGYISLTTTPTFDVDLHLASGLSAGDVFELVDSVSGTVVVAQHTISAADVTAALAGSDILSLTVGSGYYTGTAYGVHAHLAKDLAGNTGSGSSGATLTFKVGHSMQGIAMTLAAASDTGVQGDNLTNSSTPSVSVDLSSLTGLQVGDLVNIVDTDNDVVVGHHQIVQADVGNTGSLVLSIALNDNGTLDNGVHDLALHYVDSGASGAGQTSNVPLAIDVETMALDTASDAPLGVNAPVVVNFTNGFTLSPGAGIDISDGTQTLHYTSASSQAQLNSNGSGSTLVITPGVSLHYGVQYHVTLTSGTITDNAGNVLSPGTLMLFNTESAPAPPEAPAMGLTDTASVTGASYAPAELSDGITSNGTINITGLASGATWEYSTDGGSSWTSGSGTSFVLPQASYAIGNVEVRQSTSDGTSAPVLNTQAWVIDTTAPLAQIVPSATSFPYTPQQSVTITGQYSSATGLQDEIVEIDLNNGDGYQRAVTSSSSPGIDDWTITGVLGSSGNIAVRISDVAGNSLLFGESLNHVIVLGSDSSGSMDAWPDSAPIYMGSGDTTFNLRAPNHNILSGGTGTDTVSLEFSNQVLPLANLSGIEVINLSPTYNAVASTGNMIVDLSAANVAALTDLISGGHQLTVDGNNSDTVYIDSASWYAESASGGYLHYHGSSDSNITLLIGDDVTVRASPQLDPSTIVFASGGATQTITGKFSSAYGDQSEIVQVSLDGSSWVNAVTSHDGADATDTDSWTLSGASTGNSFIRVRITDQSGHVINNTPQGAVPISVGTNDGINTLDVVDSNPVYGGSHYDYFYLHQTTHGILSGGSATDTLVFYFNNGTVALDSTLTGIDQIQMAPSGGYTGNTISAITPIQAAAMTDADSGHTLVIRGDGTDNVYLALGWHDDGPASGLYTGFETYHATAGATAILLIGSAITVHLTF